MLLTVLLSTVIFASSIYSSGQETHQWTERENLGFKGPVRSVLTTVSRPNPDPRPQTKRRLSVQGNPDWAVFDLAGRRLEFPKYIRNDSIGQISKCIYKNDGEEVCTDGSGEQYESQKKETTMADGTHEVTYFLGGKIISREVTVVDENGNVIGSRDYDNVGRLTLENSTLPNGNDEMKIYDQNGQSSLYLQTHVSDDKTRFDRWSYGPNGNLVWHLAINDNGELLSDWYDVGYKPKISSSDSLGICRPRLCVSYKFDERGSGRLEKTVQHTPGEGNVEPDDEEHYNFDGIMDERIDIKYLRDTQGNWTSRSVFVWDTTTNQMTEIEQDTRTIQYY